MRVKRRLRWAVIPMGVATAIALAACTPTELNGYLPGFQEDGIPATNHTERVAGLWTTSWIVLLVVGVITWALMGFAAVAYRRRKGQTGLPVQMRYNMPMEILYTVIPLILVVGLFAFTARDQTEIETQYAEPDACITAIGKQWAWDFQYAQADCEDASDAVYTMGVQAQTNERGDIINEIPTLVLPVNQEVKIKLVSRDVIHSFWIIDFLYKKDMYIGKDNYMSFIPTREGTFEGKCAELCGQYHSMMLFNVEVVSEAEYDEYIESLRAKGQTGDINDVYDRLQNLPGTDGTASAEGDH